MCSNYSLMMLNRLWKNIEYWIKLIFSINGRHHNLF